MMTKKTVFISLAAVAALGLGMTSAFATTGHGDPPPGPPPEPTGNPVHNTNTNANLNANSNRNANRNNNANLNANANRNNNANRNQNLLQGGDQAQSTRIGIGPQSQDTRVGIGPQTNQNRVGVNVSTPSTSYAAGGNGYGEGGAGYGGNQDQQQTQDLENSGNNTGNADVKTSSVLDGSNSGNSKVNISDNSRSKTTIEDAVQGFAAISPIQCGGPNATGGTAGWFLGIALNDKDCQEVRRVQAICTMSAQQAYVFGPNDRGVRAMKEACTNGVLWLADKIAQYTADQEIAVGTEYPTQWDRLITSKKPRSGGSAGNATSTSTFSLAGALNSIGGVFEGIGTSPSVPVAQQGFNNK